ncbi:hypothetical protein BO83DRAFT_458124 [Aspergillus eucalypticola CBS 122712]|uniref:Uncharacterized protein n=1 Tax=Aspergillus eucalypticola (strain CBS 122712 / IBT 29274) TaxID=1448314 RepID=A0A317ULR4_ASPEC|nr:uncharacterized protein BO83DRAFT_458124 [Aspergillus eucalypticola CBS 122712]PWY62824.1 hypothetical protein BO83DRAFT_458124 [Aspergillus eucalypticola CBS 122712]
MERIEGQSEEEEEEGNEYISRRTKRVQILKKCVWTDINQVGKVQLFGWADQPFEYSSVHRHCNNPNDFSESSSANAVIKVLDPSSYMGTGYGGLDSAHEGVDRVLIKYA